MALVNIILKDEEISLDISDDIAILFLKRLGFFDNNKQYNNNIVDDIESKKTEQKSIVKVKNKTKSKDTLQSKAERYGINKLKREYESGEKSLDYFLNLFEVKESTFRKLLHTNGIRKIKSVNVTKVDKPKIDTNNVIVFKKTSKNKSKKDINVINAHINKEMKHLEKMVKVESGTCLKCAYKDKIDGACDYSLITLKDRRGNKGMCNHFIDVEDLND